MPAAFQSKILVYKKPTDAARANRALRISHRTLSKRDFLFRKTRNVTKYLSGLPLESKFYHAVSKLMS